MSQDEAARPGGFFLSGAPICVFDSITETVVGPPGPVVVSGSLGGINAP